MGLLDGKKIVITGVLTDASLAFGVAQLALDEGPTSCSRAQDVRSDSPNGRHGS